MGAKQTRDSLFYSFSTISVRLVSRSLCYLHSIPSKLVAEFEFEQVFQVQEVQRNLFPGLNPPTGTDPFDCVAHCASNGACS